MNLPPLMPPQKEARLTPLIEAANAKRLSPPYIFVATINAATKGAILPPRIEATRININAEGKGAGLMAKG